MRLILVTGANGFVGRHMVRALSARGLPYRAAVRNESAVPEKTELGSVCAVGDSDGNTNWTPALDRVSAVVHLATQVHLIRDRAMEPLAKVRDLICDTNPPSVTALITKICKALGVADRNISVPPAPLRLGFKLTGRRDFSRRLLDNFVIDSSPFARDLAWQAPSSLEGGINQTAHWFKQSVD